MSKRNAILTIVGLFAFLFTGFGSAPLAHASPSMTVSPSSGPVYTQVKATLTGLVPSSYVFIRFDGADYPEWQQKADKKGSAVFSGQLYKFPASVTKGSQTTPMKGGIHIIEAYAQGPNGKFLVSTTFSVIDSSNPPKLTVTPSSGPVGTKVEVRAINVPPLTSPRLALKDGIERVTYQEVKLQSDGSWTGTYTIPKEVVKYYDISGKPVIIPVNAGGHSLMLYEATEIVSAPFTVTETKIPPVPTPTPVRDVNICNPDIPSYYIEPGCTKDDPIMTPTPPPTPAPVPTPTPTPTPTPVQDVNICNPDIPSYSQPGCTKKETSTVTPSPSTGKTCDPNIPRYAQEGCKEASTPGTSTEKPATQKNICNPDIPSYSQPGCTPAGTTETTPEKKTEPIDPEGTRGRRFIPDPASVEKKTWENTTAEDKPTCNPDIPSYSQIGCIFGGGQKESISEIEPQGGRAGRGIVAGSIERGTQLEDIQKKTQLIQDNRFDEILAELKELRNKVKEQEVELKYLRGLTKGLESLKAEIKDALTKFITYGVDTNSQKLGAGERAAVLNSYKEAYDKLPESDEEMSDMIKIVNGRFPAQRNAEAEKSAIQSFKKIYKRVPNLMSNQNDAAAIMVMAYGLRQAAENRNLASEKRGIETFKSLFGKSPQTTDEWNTMQAITYSGAQRRPDQDKDMLSDEDEKIFGIDPTNPDMDKDGFFDGLEIENYNDPLNAAANASLNDADWLLPKIANSQKGNSGIEPAGIRGRRFIEDAG